MALDVTAGVVPVLCAAFAPDGALDLPAFERQVAWLSEHPFPAVALGIGTELPRLSESERVRMIQAARSTLGDGKSLIAGLDAGSTESAVDQAEAAVDAGASMIMLRPLSSDLDSLARQFQCVAEASGLPLMLQDAQGFNSAPVSTAVLMKLCVEVPAITVLKIEGGDAIRRIRAVRAVSPDIPIFGGSGGLEFVYELEAGANGSMPGPAVAAALHRVWSVYETFDRDLAWSLFASLIPLLSLQSRSFDVFLTLQKSLLRDWGAFDSDRLRAPFSGADELRRDRDLAITSSRVDLRSGAVVTR